IACLIERGRNAVLLRSVQQAADPMQARQAILTALQAKVAEAMRPSELDHIHPHLRQLPPPAARPGLTGEDWRGAVAVFLLVFASTFSVVVPSIFMGAAGRALHVSNAIAIALLFGTGYTLAGHAGLSPIRTGIAMVIIGS